jgi:hypothetical protein
LCMCDGRGVLWVCCGGVVWRQVRFVPPSAGPALVGGAATGCGQPAAVITASIDKSMALWTPGESGVWMPTSRVGEVGGHTLGFFGGLVSPSGNLILAHGYLVSDCRVQCLPQNVHTASAIAWTGEAGELCFVFFSSWCLLRVHGGPFFPVF